MNNVKYINVHKEAVRQTCAETIDMIHMQGEPAIFMQITGFVNAEGLIDYTMSYCGDNSFLTKIGLLEYMKQFILVNYE